MRIVEVLPIVSLDEPSGTVLYATKLSEELAKRGHEVTVIGGVRRGTKPSLITHENINYRLFPVLFDIWNINPFSYLLPTLKKLAKKDDFQLVHAHSSIYFSTWQAILAKRWNRVPLLLQLHGGVGVPEVGTTLKQSIVKRGFDKLIMKPLLKRSDWVGSVSRYDLKLLERQFGYTSGMHIPNAIDWDHFTKKNDYSKSEAFKIGYVGDLETWKGVNDLVEAFSQLENKNIELHIVGSGSLSLKLQKKAQKNQRIHFHNIIPHTRIREFYEQLDLICLPSYWEGAPTIILEAISMGIPVCASSVGEIPAMIPKKWLFKPKAIAELTLKLNYMIENHENLIKEVKEWKEVLKSQYSWKNIVEKIEKLQENQP